MPKVGRIAKVGCDEARPTACSSNGIDRFRTTFSVAAMHHDLGSVPGQVQGNGPSNAGCGSSDERLLALKVVLLRRRHVWLL
jgi:hypothetical protein